MVAFRLYIGRVTLLVMLGLLTVFACLTYVGLTNLLSHHIDDELLVLAQQESRQMEFKTGTLAAKEEDDDHDLREAARSTVIVSPGGAIVWKGAAVVLRPPLDPAQLAAVGGGHVVYDTIMNPGAEPVRRISYPVTVDGVVQYILQTETSLRLVEETLNLLIVLLAILAAAMAGAAWVGSRWLARLALMPVETLTATAENISVRSLNTRMELDAPYEEFSRLARVFNAMLDRLNHVFESQRRFIADAAHEMQTPLTVMKGMAEVALQKSRHADEYRDALVTNLGQVERLTTLTRSLLTLAQFAGDRPPVHLVPLALEPLVSRLVKDLTVLAEDRKIRLLLEEHPVPLVLGDKGRLTQVLVNLLDNALAHTQEGGTVHVRLHPVNEQVVLEVEDTGVGIAPEQLPHVFERFYRGDPSRQRDSGGAGLGLAIVKEIVDAHKGTVGVESVMGKGTRFSVTLPSYMPPGSN